MRRLVITIAAVLGCLVGGFEPRAESAASNDVAVLGVVLQHWSKCGERSYYVVSAQTVSIDDSYLLAVPRLALRSPPERS